jgi:hypothetical protein
MKRRTWELRALARGGATWVGTRSLLGPYLGNHRLQLENILGTPCQMSDESLVTRQNQLKTTSAFLSLLKSEKQPKMPKFHNFECDAARLPVIQWQ